MGLDQYWFREPTIEEKAEALIESRPLSFPTKFGYHRKYYPLAEVMRKHFKLNKYELEVTTEILDDVTKFANEKSDEYLLSIVNSARNFLAKNIKVVYTESW